MSRDEAEAPYPDDALATALRHAAHELLEPLLTAEAYITLVDTRLDPRAHGDSRERLAAAARALVRARIVVEAIMLDRVVPERELVRRPVDLEWLAAECVRLLEPEIAARGAKLRIGPLPTVQADEALLGAVLKNLLVNGLKHGQGGTIEVSGERRDGEWRVAVASSGPAIPDAAREAIFLPDRRGPDGARGAGLGLAICRRIVERHGGGIHVEPGPADTNVFVFTLPA